MPRPMPAPCRPRFPDVAAAVTAKRLVEQTHLPPATAEVVADWFVKTQSYYEDYLRSNDLGPAKCWRFCIVLPVFVCRDIVNVYDVDRRCIVEIALAQSGSDADARWGIRFIDWNSHATITNAEYRNAEMELLETGTVEVVNYGAPGDYESAAIHFPDGSIMYYGTWSPPAA